MDVGKQKLIGRRSNDNVANVEGHNVYSLVLPIFAGRVCNYLGSGCGSVGRAVASDTKDLQFKSSPVIGEFD